MDGDELLGLWISCGLAVFWACRWYASLIRVRTLASHRAPRSFLALVPIGCIGLVQLALSWGAAHEIKDDPSYDFLFLAGGGALLGLVTACLPIVALSGRDDAIESHNVAAVAAVCGAWIGSTFCYAGGNIGEGPTIWTTFVPAFGAVFVLLLLWFVLERLTHISNAISIDRDLASGVRLAGFLVAAGLILGRSVAGDWHSWESTLRDFYVEGWPVLPLMVIAAAFQFAWRPSPQMPRHRALSRGILPAGGMIAIAVMYVIFLGRPEHITAGR